MRRDEVLPFPLFSLTIILTIMYNIYWLIHFCCFSFLIPILFQPSFQKYSRRPIIDQEMERSALKRTKNQKKKTIAISPPSFQRSSNIVPKLLKLPPLHHQVISSCQIPSNRNKHLLLRIWRFYYFLLLLSLLLSLLLLMVVLCLCVVWLMMGIIIIIWWSLLKIWTRPSCCSLLRSQRIYCLYISWWMSENRQQAPK